MFKARILQSLAVVLTAVVVWGAGRHLSTLDTAAAETPTPQAPTPRRAEPSEAKAERLDALGDPLPAGAVARLIEIMRTTAFEKYPAQRSLVT